MSEARYPVSLFSISSYPDIEFLWKNNRPETMSLEFKRLIDADDVAKDVSSFANADGGVIIYGVDETKGRAVKSEGMKLKQNAEQVQSIVSSSTAPRVPMTIERISNPNDDTMEFLVVKIPASPFYIHQVTTSGKYYVRANTTTEPHVFNPVTLGENDIARRYEARFQNRLVAESFVKEKEAKIFRHLNYQGWREGLILSVVPHVPIPDAIKLTAQEFRQYFVDKSSTVTYEDMLTDGGVPSIDGRHTDFRSAKLLYIEIDKDRSIFYCRANTETSRVEVFDPIFMTGELLHLASRIMTRTKHYGGMTFRLHLTGGLSNKAQERGITLYQSESDISFVHELPPAPFDMKVEMSSIFEKYFEAIHIDNSLTKYPETIPRIQQLWREYDRRSWENSS